MAVTADPDSHLIPSLITEWVKNEISPIYSEYLRFMEQSSSDPPANPFLSLYSAREKLLSIQDMLKNSVPSDVQEFTEEITSLRVHVLTLLAINYINTEETSRGQEEFEKVLDLANSVTCQEKVAFALMSSLNQLGVLWGNRNEPQRSLKLLLQAKSVYESNSAPPTDRDWLHGQLRDVGEREREFEDLHTHTLFYLAQVYANLDEPKLAAEYCQLTLSRQLETKMFDPIEWSMNVAGISQYYINVLNFPQARHCLAAGTVMLSRFNVEEQLNETLKEKFEQASADLSRCWVKYCLLLLRKSCDYQSGGSTAIEKLDVVHKFEPLELTDIEKEVESDIVEGYPSARSVFLFGQRHIDIAKSFFTLEEHASDNVSIVQDHSKLFYLLSYFESDIAIKCRMHKRRIDMLTALIPELNPQHYLVLVRQLVYEVAEAYAEMGNLKILSAEDESAPSQARVTKINSLLESSIAYYQKYIDTFSGPIDLEYTSYYLTAKLGICRLHTKLLCGSLIEEVSHLETALKGYQWLVDYCISHANEVDQVFKEEFGLCQEMVELLPQKIELIKSKC